MSVIRINKRKDFTVICNYLFKDESLSLKAKGLLAQMLSLPDNWGYTERGLEKMVTDSRHSIRTGLDELENAGYIKRTRKRNKDGQFICVYDVFEKPQKSKNPVENPVEKPASPGTEIEPGLVRFSDAEKRTISNTKELNTNNKKKIIKEKSFEKVLADIESSELREALDEFAKARKLLKKPLTTKALQLLISKLDKLASSEAEKIAIVNQSIENGWAGVFPLKEQGSNTTRNPYQPAPTNVYKPYGMPAGFGLSSWVAEPAEVD